MKDQQCGVALVKLSPPVFAPLARLARIGGDVVISDALNHASIIDGCRAIAKDAARDIYKHADMSDLSHVDETGRVRMVDVGAKPVQQRRAVARAFVRMAPETVAKLGDLPKGDALTTASGSRGRRW